MHIIVVVRSLLSYYVLETLSNRLNFNSISPLLVPSKYSLDYYVNVNSHKSQNSNWMPIEINPCHWLRIRAVLRIHYTVQQSFHLNRNWTWALSNLLHPSLLSENCSPCFSWGIHLHTKMANMGAKPSHLTLTWISILIWHWASSINKFVARCWIAQSSVNRQVVYIYIRRSCITVRE